MNALPASVIARDVGPRYRREFPRKKAQIARFIALGYSELGLDLDVSHGDSRMFASKSCIVGNMLGFEVDGRFESDIDEPVNLTLTYLPA